MSYANGTTHYNLPQTVGTDKRDWFDTNQAFADIDEALYGAVEQATSIASAVTALTTRVGTAEENIADLQTSRTTDEANIAALQTLTSQHTTQIADVKADALDMICAVDEGTAQVASVAVTSGHYFRYNDVLYIATADIAVGDTIVPNTNCRATNVATELESGTSITVDADDVSFNDTTSSLGANNVQDAIDALKALLAVGYLVSTSSVKLSKQLSINTLELYNAASSAGIISGLSGTYNINNTGNPIAIPCEYNDGSANVQGNIQITTSGTIRLYNYGFTELVTATSIRGTCSWIG